MDLALNNLQKLICHKTNKPTNQPTIKMTEYGIKLREKGWYVVKQNQTTFSQQNSGIFSKQYSFHQII